MKMLTNTSADKIVLFLGILMFTTASQSFSEPVIQRATGNYFDGKTISINGTGFGASGPNLILYDHFNNGTAGAQIPITAPTIGAWTANNINPPTYDEGQSSGYGMRTFTSGKGTQQFKAQFPTTSEIFISYWVKLPNAYFPNTTIPNSFPPSSSWKLAWLMNGQDGYRGQDDLCLPSFIDGRNFAIAGNGPAFQLRTGNTDTDRWFSFDEWMRITVYLKGGSPDPAINNGVAWLQVVNGSTQKSYKSISQPVMGGDFNGNPRGWTNLNFPGWLNGPATQSTRPVYDDIYVATGTNALARVEIGNAPSYTSCSKLALATTTNWSDSSITATIRQGNFAVGQEAYLYVSDAQGVVNNVGFPIVIGTGSLVPPANLKGTAK